MKNITKEAIAQAIINQDQYATLSAYPECECETPEESVARESKSKQQSINATMLMLSYLSHVTGRNLKAAEIAACNAIAAMDNNDDDAPYDHDAHAAIMESIAGYAADKE